MNCLALRQPSMTRAPPGGRHAPAEAAPPPPDTCKSIGRWLPKGLLPPSDSPAAEPATSPRRCDDHRLPGQQIICTAAAWLSRRERDSRSSTRMPQLAHCPIATGLPPRPGPGLWRRLDVAIASALQAAWYYKWLRSRGRTVAAAATIVSEANVLFDLTARTRLNELNRHTHLS